eukprot:4673472-Pleurochrysis_carterae.AAC.1
MLPGNRAPHTLRMEKLRTRWFRPQRAALQTSIAATDAELSNHRVPRYTRLRRQVSIVSTKNTTQVSRAISRSGPQIRRGGQSVLAPTRRSPRRDTPS